MDWTISTIVRKWAEARPDKVAVSCGERMVTYAEMERRSNCVAQGLLAIGLKRGGRVALLDKNRPEQFDVLFGASKAGTVLVPVNWRLAPSEIAYVLENASAEVVFVGAEFLEALFEIRAQLSKLREIVVFGDVDGCVSFETWLERYPPNATKVEVQPADTALQLYTSGTTGLPKGVMLSATNLFTLLNHAGNLWGLAEGSVSIVCLPLFHIGGIGWALACMRYGGTVELVRRFDADAVLALIETSRVTHANFVPAMLAMMVEAARKHRHDYSSLETILYGTAPISSALLVQSIAMFGCEFIQVYGLTETTSAITQLDAADHDPSGSRRDLLRSAGRPYPWIEAKIVDPSNGRSCTPCETGELWVRSAQNTQGYWRNEVATAEAITVDGWLRTGDAGYLNEDGYLFLTDRIKDMIVSGGENIYPAEIENVLAEHPNVAEVAVIGIPHATWGETVKAVIVPKAGTTPTERDLIDWTRERLARYKCPTSISLVSTLPRNATGKLLKRVLREPYWKGASRRIN